MGIHVTVNALSLLCMHNQRMTVWTDGKQDGEEFKKEANNVLVGLNMTEITRDREDHEWQGAGARELERLGA